MEAQSEPEAEESGDASVVLIESERTEVAAAAPLEGLEELSATVEVKEKSGEGRSCSEGAEIPVSVPRDVSAAGAYPLLERRTSWWNCCGLLDVFGGSRS